MDFYSFLQFVFTHRKTFGESKKHFSETGKYSGANKIFQCERNIPVRLKYILVDSKFFFVHKNFFLQLK